MIDSFLITWNGGRVVFERMNVVEKDGMCLFYRFMYEEILEIFLLIFYFERFFFVVFWKDGI